MDRLGSGLSGCISISRIIVFLGYAALLPVPLITKNYYLMRAGGSVGIYLMLAAGLSIVAGQAGLLDLGYAGFYGIGAYVYALLASPQFGIHMPFFIAAAASVAAAVLAAFAVSLPTLRLHGDYLAMVTLGFGQIVRILLNNMDRPINITNGPNGIVAIDPPRIFGFTLGSMEAQYVFIWIFAAAVLIGISRLAGSRVGRAWNALRENETAAECMGVNVRRYRVSAFAGAAAIAGLAGALFASWQSAVFPQNFTMSETIAVYCMLVLGGARSVPGIMLGVLLLQVLPEVLRAYSVYRMLIYGFALVLLAIFRPQGLIAAGERLIGIDPGKVADKIDAPSGAVVDAACDACEACSETLAPVLEVEGLSCNFGGLAAVSDVSFSVERGEILGIIGPNGAGKTTIFNLITGLVNPSGGDIRLYGRSIVGKAPHEVAAMGAARTFQNIRLYESQSVLENVLAGCHLRQDAHLGAILLKTKSHLRQEEEDISYVRNILREMECGLAERESDIVAELSYPDKRRVEMARALATGARFILLDEPAAGMTAEEIKAMAAEIVALRDRGYTIVVIEHHMDLIAAACDRVIVLDHGQKIAEGLCSEVAEDPEVIRAYFGGSQASKRKPEESDVRAAASKSASPLLELVDVHSSYGPAVVLQGVNLCVNPGEAVALLGVNAAGKSTMLKTITGRLRPTRGQILFAGERIDGRPTNEVIRMGMGVVPEGRRVFPGLTVMENLEVAADAVGSLEQAREGIDRAFSVFAALASRRSQLAGTLSGGEQQMLAIARALVTSPRLICMDEPSMGLAPIMVERVMEAISEINRAGTAVLLVEQNARAALSVADRVYVLKDGRTSASAEAGAVLRDDSGGVAKLF
ncbi:MAG: ATP-binding cassette domain-containing protein [Bacillota bacterium]